MAIEVFSRHENKYLIEERIRQKLQDRIADFMEPDEYNKTRETYAIANLFYDTDDSQLIRTSLQKPMYKEKLRLRSYGVPDLNDPVYLEIKKKYDGLVSKRRSVIRLDEAYSFLGTGQLPEPDPAQNRQVLREIAYIRQVNDLKPMLYLAYDRQAWFGRDDQGLRISFDTRIRSRRTDLRLEAGDSGRLLLPPDVWLLEIKTARSIPVWLARLLSAYHVYPASFSKYGCEYQQMLAGRQLAAGGQPAQPSRVRVSAPGLLRPAAY